MSWGRVAGAGLGRAVVWAAGGHSVEGGGARSPRLPADFPPGHRRRRIAAPPCVKQRSVSLRSSLVRTGCRLPAAHRSSRNV